MKKYLLSLFIFLFIATFMFANIDDLFKDIDFFKVEEQLVVTASRRAQKISEAPATIYVITDREIEQFGFVDLKDVIKLIPGMIVEDGSYGQTYGGQRGFGGTFSKTLIMINGREINNLLAGEAFIGPQFPLHNVKRIEVIAGPGSALYGANAFAGVINIITKDASDMNGVEASYTIGKNNTNLLTLNYGNTTEKSDFKFSARYKTSDGWDFSDYVSRPEHWNASQFGPGSGWSRNPQGLLVNEEGLVFRTPNTHGDRYENPEEAKYIDFNYLRKINSTVDYIPDDFYFGGNVYQMTTGHGMTKTQWLNWEGYDHREHILAYAGFNKSLLNNKLQLNFETRYQTEWTEGNHTAIGNIFDYPDTIELSPGGVYDYWGNTVDDDNDTTTPYTPTKLQIEKLRGWWSNKDNNAERYYVQLQANYEVELFGLEHNLIGGLVYDRKDASGTAWSLSWSERADGEMGVDFDRQPGFSETNHNQKFLSQTKYAVYLQDQFALMNNQLLTTIGLRYDYHKNDDSDPAFSYGGLFNPRLGLIYKYTPKDTFKLLYGSAFREPSPFEQADGLQPEEMQTYEIGYIRNDRNYNYDLNVNLYINKATNYIVSMPKEDGGYIYGNAGNVDVFGGEMVLTYQPINQLRFNLNYTYQTAELTAEGLKTDINPLPKHQANLLTSWNIYRNLNIGWTVKWRDEVENLNNTISGIQNPIRKIDSYMIHDISFLAKRIFGNDRDADQIVDLSFTVHNLFDKEYENSNFRWSNPSMEDPNVLGQPGRTYYLKLTANF